MSGARRWDVGPIALVGVGEAAAILGVSKQRVHQLASSGMPAPVASLASTPVWLESDVRLYALTRNQRPGRSASPVPPKSAPNE